MWVCVRVWPSVMAEEKVNDQSSIDGRGLWLMDCRGLRLNDGGRGLWLIESTGLQCSEAHGSGRKWLAD